MRKLCWILIVLAVAAANAWAKENIVNSKVTDVVVYPNHAQVTRMETVDIKKGDNKFVFTQLVAVLDDKSVRATCDGPVELTGTEIRHKYLNAALSGKLAEYDRMLEQSGDKLAEWQKQLDAWREEKKFYYSIKAKTANEIKEGMERKALSVEEWKKIMHFCREGVAETDDNMLRISREMREEKKKQAQIKAERAGYLSGSPREMKEIVVSLHAAKDGKAEIMIHYLVPNATWRPVYDVHLSNDGKEVKIVGYGLIIQGTGEAWENVKVSLAMAQPEYELALPELATMYIAFSQAELRQLAADVQQLNEAANSEVWLKSRFQNKKQQQVFKQNLVEMQNSMKEVQLRGVGISQDDISRAVKRISNRFAGVNYKLSRRESILSDRTPHKVQIFSKELSIDLRHVATPGLEDVIVRRGDLTNTSGFAFIEGESSIFVNGSYVGFSRMPGTAPNEPLSIFFGPDDSLKASRDLVKYDVVGPEKFRKSKLATYHYKITLDNFKKTKTRVELHDQIPVAQTSEIQVRLLKSSHTYKVDDKGIITWDLEVPAGKSIEVTFSFEIEHPVNQTIYWK
ncbi:mucoidy inhibitor MuiA family protein [Planctomycetota bacterium]